MIFLAQLHGTILTICVIAILVTLLGLFLRKYKQPYIMGYILVGVLMGKHGLDVIDDSLAIESLGELGVIVLLFFIGMEISLPKFLKRWRLAIIGTLLQLSLSVLITILIGYFISWSVARSIVLGFIIALSSSAVIIKILQDRNLVKTRIGNNVLIILLTQDILIVPLLIITSFLSGQSESLSTILIKIVGGIAVMAILIYIYLKKQIKLPFSETIKDDHELQVFTAILFCFGGALLTELFGLSGALGAFVGGLVIHTAQSTKWIFDALHSFRIFFVALFFISIGLQIDLDFIYANLWVVFLVLSAVYITNHFLNSIILKVFACSWKEAILGGALLAQIGELSFLINSVAFDSGIFEPFSYQFTISIISLTLLISPLWIAATEKLLSKSAL